MSTLQATAERMALDSEQVAALRVLSRTYHQRVTAIKAERVQHLMAMQTGRASLLSPELAIPNQAASSAAAMGRLRAGTSLQQETYLHLIRSFVLGILTPYQAGLLCAASYPYLVEFPAVIGHLIGSDIPQ